VIFSTVFWHFRAVGYVINIGLVAGNKCECIQHNGRAGAYNVVRSLCKLKVSTLISEVEILYFYLTLLIL